jgi:hypothetical protein
MFACARASAQNYTFSPSENYTGELSMDMYTEHYMYIGHNLPDTAFITWRVVENTCPEEWDIQACDYQHCYTGLPNNGDMNGVPPGGQGYLRMIVNPFTTTGTGMLHLLIYPTGQPTLYTEAFFNFSTPTSAVDLTNDETAIITIQGDEVNYSGIDGKSLRLYGMNGSLVDIKDRCTASGRISLHGLCSGIYILRTSNGKSYTVYYKGN